MAEQYKYVLASSGYSSARYGNCEICGKHCSQVFIQREARWINYDDAARRALKTDDAGGWTYYKCVPTMFGHEACLVSSRRDS